MTSSNQTKGNLILIPNLISGAGSISPEIKSELRKLKYFLAETPKNARRFIRKADEIIPLENLDIQLYNKKTTRAELLEMLQPLLNGKDIGIITDSGMPGVADPGSLAVSIAHEWGVRVKPVAGASSLVLALSASGLPGQQFSFHGYLPVKENDCIKKLKALESESAAKNYSQIFIETPYRNQRLFQIMLKTLKPESRLCVAYDITGSEEKIITQSIKAWKQNPFEFGKLPCVFILHSSG